MGLPGQLDHPKVAAAFERVIAACKANGVTPGIGGVYDPPLLKRYVQMGFRMVLAGSDLSFLMMRSEEHTSELQSLMRIAYAVFCLKNKVNNLLYIIIII